MNAIAMLRSHHDRSGYTRLDNMVDLERRLVRKLGTSEPPVRSQSCASNQPQIALYWWGQNTFDMTAVNDVPGVLLRCILFQLP